MNALDQVIQPFIYHPEHRRDLIVQGSSPINAHGSAWRLPVYPPMRASVMPTASPIPPEQRGLSYCTVERGHQAVTCHICEGGHHAHIKWGM